MKYVPNTWGSSLTEFNKCHNPSGHPDGGGRFCSSKSKGGDASGSKGGSKGGSKSSDSTKRNNPLTKTPEFKRWFEGSVVVNDDGSPRVMYHATNADIEEFRPFSHFGTAQAANDRYKHLIQFDDQINAVTGSNRRRTEYRVIPVYLSLKSPLRLPDIA